MNPLYIVFIYYVEDVKLILIVCISLSSEICLMQLGNFSAAISWREQVNFPGQPVFALSPYDGKKFIKLMFFVYIYAVGI